MDLLFREATEEDLPRIVGLIADDEFGAARDDASLPLKQDYLEAFRAIDGDPRNRLIVACLDEELVGTLQLTFIPGIARSGALRGQIEAVRVVNSRRDQGIGGRIMIWAIEECRKMGCRLVQLTSEKKRDDAHRFYGRLGFQATHTGFKLKL